MEELTEKLWAQQDQHQGDRLRLFSALANAIQADKVLYPGSFVDLAPSFVFDSVTYVDIDRRTPRFFADTDGVAEIIATNRGSEPSDRPKPDVSFISADYRNDLGLQDQSFDLLVSLYAGFISEHCTRYLRVGGWLLVNPSHGDAAMASIDPRYRLGGVVRSRSGRYDVSHDNLDQYLLPKKPQTVTADGLHKLGKGIAYTTSAFAYLFERVG